MYYVLLFSNRPHLTELNILFMIQYHYEYKLPSVIVCSIRISSWCIERIVWLYGDELFNPILTAFSLFAVIFVYCYFLCSKNAEPLKYAVVISIAVCFCMTDRC